MKIYYHFIAPAGFVLIFALLLLGKDLLDWIGLGVGPDKDPYVAKTNSECLNGDLAECFKSRALQTFDEFFEKVLDKIQKGV